MFKIVSNDRRNDVADIINRVGFSYSIRAIYVISPIGSMNIGLHIEIYASIISA